MSHEQPDSSAPFRPENDPTQPTLSIAILSGGKSTRMGQDKAFVRLGSQTLIARSITALSPLTDDLFIIANDQEAYASLRRPVYSDLIPKMGPLGGVYTALSRARHTHCLVAAVDLPMLQPALLRYLISLSTGTDLVLPLIDNHPQGTLAIYSRRLLPDITHALEHQALKLARFFSEIDRNRVIRRVDEVDLRKYDPQLRSFTNVNTISELEACADRLPPNQQTDRPVQDK